MGDLFDEIKGTDIFDTIQTSPTVVKPSIPGNINLATRPVVKNPDGTISTIKSISVNIDNNEILIPTVTPEGVIISDEEAIDLYRRTGKHLGIFRTPENATKYAKQLHIEQEQQYDILDEVIPENDTLKKIDLFSVDLTSSKKEPDPFIGLQMKVADKTKQQIKPTPHQLAKEKAFKEAIGGIPKEMLGLVVRQGTRLSGGLNDLLSGAANLIGWEKGRNYFAAGAVQGEQWTKQMETPLTDPIADLGMSMLMGAAGGGLSYAMMAKHLPFILKGAQGALASIGTGATTAATGDYLINRIIEEINPVLDESPMSPTTKTVIRMTVPLVLGALSGATLESQMARRLGDPTTVSQVSKVLLKDKKANLPELKRLAEPEKIFPEIPKGIKTEIDTEKAALMRILEESKELTGITKGIKRAEAKALKQAITPLPAKMVSAEDYAKPSTLHMKRDPKYAGSVNLERQDISNKAKEIEIDFFTKHGIKKRVSQEKLIKEADDVVYKLTHDPAYFDERLNFINKGGTPTIPEELAFRIMNATQFENFVNITKKVATGELPRSAMDNMHNELKQIFIDTANPLASASGRRLNMYKIVVGRNRAFKAIATLNKKLTPAQMEMLADVAESDFNPTKVNALIKGLKDPKLSEYIYELFYSNILSGIPTHVVNTASNTLWLTWQVPHRGLVAGIDKIISSFSGRERYRYLDETIPLFVGMIKKTPHGVKAAKAAFFSKHLTDMDTKWGLEMQGLSSAFSRSRNKTVQNIGRVITTPLRALQAEDIFFKSLAYDSSIATSATRTALKRGLRGTEKKAFIKKFIQDAPEWAHDEAIEFSRYSTFTDSPGKISKAVDQLRKSIRGGRMVVPFINTIGNLFKRGSEMIPGFGALIARGQDPSEIIAKQIEGSVLAFIALMKAHNGELTGPSPQNKAERERFHGQGKIAWGTKFGDKWVQYRRFEPFNIPFGMAAVAYDQLKNIENEDTANEIFWNLSHAFSQHLLDSTYFQGVQTVLNRHNQLEGAFQRGVSSFVPFSSFWRSINKSYEVLTEGEAKSREVSDWLGAFSQVIPGLSVYGKPKLDVWGEEIILEGGIFRQWLPYKMRTERADITEDGLEELDMAPSHPKKTFKRGGEIREFDEDIYSNYRIAYGGAAKKHLDKMFQKRSIKKLLANEDKHPVLIKILDRQLNNLRRTYRLKAIKKQLKR